MEVDKRICCGSILSLVEIFFSLFFLVGGLGVRAGGGGGEAVLFFNKIT